MNHDATHCADCQPSCYRAQLTEELQRIVYPLPTSWANFRTTSECYKTKEESIKT